MTLVQRSEKTGHSDGSFSYRGCVVQPHVLGSNFAGVTVDDEYHFDSWRDAREWIDTVRSIGDEADA